MDSRDVMLVQTSFTPLAPRGAELAGRFYAQLFSDYPRLEALFSEDIEKQGLKLMATLQLVVQALHEPERLAPALRRLGLAHAAYGVREEHYVLAGATLLDALAQTLGETFTSDVRVAWAKAYALISEAMQAAVVEAFT
jgi:hemoglobin-like flavoprotein